MFNLFDKKVKREEIETIHTMATLIHICIKVGITPKEFVEFTNPEKINEASNFLLEAMKQKIK